MAASLQIARYTSREAVRVLAAIPRLRRECDAAPGVAVARLCITADLELPTGGRPTPTRWALLCGWESTDARDAFLAEGTAARRFASGASECWSLALDTVRATGTWHGWPASNERAARLGGDEPLMVMTHAHFIARHQLTFLRHNRHVVRELAADPSVVMRVALIERNPLVRSTLSLWRSEGDVMRFAYGSGRHNPIARRSLAVPWSRETFFARFRPVSSSGTLDGRDPLAEVRPRLPAPSS